MTPGPAERGSEAGGRAPASPWVIFSVMSVALLMSSVDSTIVATALPTLHESLRASLNWVGWTITAYQLGLTVAMPVAGRISDLLGRKRVFVLCVCFFTLMSLLCGLATSVYMLVPLRFLQALGGGAFMPSATGHHLRPLRQRARPGHRALLEHLPSRHADRPDLRRGDNHLLVVAGDLLRERADRHRAHHPGDRLLPVSTKVERKAPDVVGVAQLGALLLASMYAITNLGNGHTELWSWSVLVPAAVAIMIAVSFARRSRRVLTPLIPLRLLGGKGFLVMNAINFSTASAPSASGRSSLFMPRTAITPPARGRDSADGTRCRHDRAPRRRRRLFAGPATACPWCSASSSRLAACFSSPLAPLA